MKALCLTGSLHMSMSDRASIPAENNKGDFSQKGEDYEKDYRFTIDLRTCVRYDRMRRV